MNMDMKMGMDMGMDMGLQPLMPRVAASHHWVAASQCRAAASSARAAAFRSEAAAPRRGVARLHGCMVARLQGAPLGDEHEAEDDHGLLDYGGEHL